MTTAISSGANAAPWKRIWLRAVAGLPLSGLGGWVLCVLLAIDVISVTKATDFSIRNMTGEYWLVWLLVVAVELLLAGCLVARFRPDARLLRPVEVIAILAVTAMVMTDVTMMWAPLRDLGIYLKAGNHYLAGSPVYMSAAITAAPADPKDLPYLYPPFTLPVFGALAILPQRLAEVVWSLGSVGLAIFALRRIGLPGRLAVLALLWPPIFVGVWVGNVAVPALALFAIGPWLGSGLVLGAAFKSYTGLASLWLVRERRWVELGTGIALLLILAALTMPLVGVDLWFKWLAALGWYQKSQDYLPGLYGFGLVRYVPFVLYLAASAAAVLAAFLVRGRESLARFGTATIVASPSLFGHGLLVAVPSLLSLRSPWLWLALGLLSTPQNPHWLLAVGLILLSWVVPGMRRQPQADLAVNEPLHPLGAGGEVWPDTAS
ncbi:MAG TPA: glycosyltransferase family 87 protein [Candidatus Limnocylindrales bacterium]